MLSAGTQCAQAFPDFMVVLSDDAQVRVIEQTGHYVTDMDSEVDSGVAGLLQHTPVLQELALILQTKTASGPLFLTIKELIMNEVRDKIEEKIALQTQTLEANFVKSGVEIERKITDSVATVTSLTTQTQQIVTDFQAFAANNSSIIQSLRDDIAILTTDFGKVKGEVRVKAEAIHLNEVIEGMSNYTPLRMTEKLESVIRTYPTYEDLSRLSDRVSDLSISLSDYVTGRELTDAVVSVRSGIQDAVKDLAQNSTLIRLKSAIEAKQGELENAIDRTKKLIETHEELAQESIHSLKAQLESHPWADDLTKLTDLLHKKAYSSEVRSLSEDISTLSARLDAFESEIQREMEGFESALQRFDEVILLKASREDLKAVKLQLKDFVTASNLDFELENVKNRFEMCEKRLIEGQEAVKSMEEKWVLVGNCVKYEDLTGLREQLEEMKVTVKSKVEQEELALVREQKGDREDATILHTNLRLHHKQLEQITVLITAILRTLLKTDTRLHRVQQREYLLKHCEALGHWVAGFDPGNYHEPQERKDLWSPRDPQLSTRNRSPRETPKLPLLATSRLRGRHGRVHSTVGTDAPLKL